MTTPAGWRDPVLRPDLAGPWETPAREREAAGFPPPPPPSGGIPAWAPPAGVRETTGTGPLWVRWAEWSSATPWRRAAAVWRDGPWLCVSLAGGGEVWTPDHIVRGAVEVRFSAEQPDA